MEADKIVDAILYDLTDRRGLRQAWEQIDNDIQEEIKKEWVKIISTSVGYETGE